MLLDEDEN
jgi:DDB1- and CUL4-associated factor 7